MRAVVCLSTYKIYLQERVHSVHLEQCLRKHDEGHSKVQEQETQHKEVQLLQNQLKHAHEQLETANQRIIGLEGKPMADCVHFLAFAFAFSVMQEWSLSPCACCAAHAQSLIATRALHSESQNVTVKSPERGGSEEESATMQTATAEVNSAVGKLVELLHGDLRERAASHRAIMTAIANEVAVICAHAAPQSPPPSVGPIASHSPQPHSVGVLIPKLPDGQNSTVQDFCNFSAKPSLAVFDSASLASMRSTRSDNNSPCSSLSANSPTLVPTARVTSDYDLEKRHSSLLALSAKLCMA